MTSCPHCAKSLPSNIRYCPYCGAEVQSWTRLVFGSFDWPFLGRWLLVTLLAWGLAWVVLTHPALSGLVAPAWGKAIGVGIIGLAMGAAQWLVTPSRSRRPRPWWALALPAGWALGTYLYAIWPRPGQGYPVVPVAGGGMLRAALIGAVMGAAQVAAARPLQLWPPARKWIAACAVVFGAVGLWTIISAQTRGYGWFPTLTFRSEGQDTIYFSDLTTAAIWGLALGAAQYPLIRRSINRGLLWPVVTAGGLIAAALVCDLVFSILVEFGVADVLAYRFFGIKVSEAVTWAVAGLGLGWGQWLLLRRTGRRAAWWIVLTTAGCVAGWAAVVLLIADDWAALGAAVAGLLAAAPLWLVARSGRPQARWLPAWNAGAWGAASLALVPLEIQPLGELLLGPMILMLVLALVSGGVLAYRPHG